MTEKSIADLHQCFYIPTIQKVALHLPHIQILELTTVARHYGSHSSVVQISNMSGDFEITKNMQYLLFSIVNEIYEYYKARSAISLFQMNELFSHHYWGFKLEKFDPPNSCNPIRFPALSNK